MGPKVQARTSFWQYNRINKSLWIWKKASLEVGWTLDEIDETSKPNRNISPQSFVFYSAKAVENDDQVVCPIKNVDNKKRNPEKFIGLDTSDYSSKQMQPFVKCHRLSPDFQVLEQSKKKKNVPLAVGNQPIPELEGPRINSATKGMRLSRTTDAISPKKI